MADDNKTNEELLEEVKKLRKIEEDREDRHRKKVVEDKWIIKFAFRFACSMIIVFIITVLLALLVT